MTFASAGSLGQGVLVPFRTSLADVSTLVTEAEELWKAEKPGAEDGSIAASWGCVGVAFRDQSASVDWLRAWNEHFRRKASPVPPVPPVTSDGLLRIPWPAVVDGSATDVELLLATATKAGAAVPLADEVADAWIGQDDGHERYFFENVRHGIRTPEDGLIWRRIEEKKPRWLTAGAHAEAIAILRDEQHSGVDQ
jgi:hypothetical protein